MKFRLALLSVLLVACSNDIPAGDPVRIVVPRGASVSSVADSLLNNGIIESKRRFRLYAKLSGSERAIQAGIYDFVPGTPVRILMRTLVRGRTAQTVFVVPEGFMISEIAATVESRVGVPTREFLEAARNAELASRLGATEPTLEGYLYPETYVVPVDATAEDIVQQMVDEFEKRWRPEWDSRLLELNMTRHEIVTLASIIQGEIHDATDGGYVSSVYHNRLRSGMPLQADPTVIYALGRRRRLFNRDYEIPSRYNTYRIAGLPPHPISQPSALAIEAALFPTQTDFLYFVAGPEGRHIFSRTYREHQATIRRIRSAG
ncbi:MAG: endolytic transglycosylase MltG [Gemmatimonadota bacterium]|nr:endolytic transglycosylase MltG [Gemmatimonadota bacterium]